MNPSDYPTSNHRLDIDGEYLDKIIVQKNQNGVWGTVATFELPYSPNGTDCLKLHIVDNDEGVQVFRITTADLANFHSIKDSYECELNDDWEFGNDSSARYSGIGVIDIRGLNPVYTYYPLVLRALYMRHADEFTVEAAYPDSSI